MDKEALSLSSGRVLKGMGAGAGLGALGGAVGGAATAQEGQGVSGALKGAIGGAAGGAALGAGAGWAVPRVQAGMKGGLTLGQSVKAVGQDARARVMPTARSTSAPARPAPAASANPTLADNQWVSSHYRALPESTRKMVEANPLVAQHGMSPEMAWQLQEMSRGKQGLGTFAARANLPQVTTPGAAAGAGAATVAPGMRSAATNAGTVAQGVRPAAADVATVAPGMRKAAYLLKNIGVEPKVRPLDAFAPKNEHRTVKKAEDEGLSPEALMLGGSAVGLGAVKARGPTYDYVVKQFGRAGSPEDVALLKRLVENDSTPVLRASEARTEHVRVPEWAEKADPVGAARARKGAAKMIREDLGGNAAYAPFAKRVYMGQGTEKSPAVVAHELGHARLDRGLGKIVQNPISTIAGQALLKGKRAIGVGAATGALGGLTDNEYAQQAGRWAPAAIAGGLLASEGGASLLGLAKMRRAGASGRQMLEGAKTLAPAFATYALPVVAGTGAAHATQGAVLKGRQLLRGDEVEKEAMIPSAGQGLKAAQKSMQSASQRLVKSQNVGVPSFKMPTPKPLNKIGFAQSAYSGPLSDGNSTKYESYIPPFRNPPVKTAGPPSEDKKADAVKTSAMRDELCKLNGLGSWLTKKLEESEAPSGYVSQVAQLSGLPEEDVRPYVRNIRPHRFTVPAEQFAKDIKPVWSMKAERYNPLHQQLTATAAGSPEEAAFLKQHGKNLDEHYNAWVGGQADLRKKYTGGDRVGVWADPEKLKVKTSNVISPTSQLTKAKKIGAPKASAPPGPSIQQVSKPVGFGTPIAGATKGAI